MADVLIIGAGASASAFAWSMADTRMRIVCLEQGDWVNPADYPSHDKDWESDPRSTATLISAPTRRITPLTAMTRPSPLPITMGWVAAPYYLLATSRAFILRTFECGNSTALPLIGLSTTPP